MFSDDALIKLLMDMEYHIPTVDLEVVLDERPDLVRRRSTMGYPLHEACMRGLPLTVIQTLVERFPEAVTANASDIWRQTPLFVACSRVDPHMETITYLVQTDYPACLEGTSERPPLLHWCMSIWNQPLLVWTTLVDWVLAQYPEAANMQDFNGQYIVHHATSTSDTKRFRQLLKTHARDRLVDAHGNNILHVAVADSHRVPHNITSILEECPEAIQWANHQGALPLHMAIKWQDRSLLLDRYPFGTLQMTQDRTTALGNVRRELERCIRVHYPEVGEVVYGEEDSDTEDDVIRRDDEDWEMPCVSWVFPTNPSFLRDLDRIFDVVNQRVLPLLRHTLKLSFQQATGCALSSEVMNEIFLFAVPHYEESLTHTPYYDGTTTS